ncbi:U24-ctenitoxin-Pn1a-like [Uloborus diversus]|uniref:U24-ctenitoxin-Pn1a-like n=1 Tax=Uloborus diversus TaxID=327109 RepID=UPI00240A21AB|nr:U24-ctenitoxin-Pn1a-like [Uloborus diversus]XP_054717057.1 U24-ctenitoxin-Pn1a-like [Uloborus diversus]
MFKYEMQVIVYVVSFLPLFFAWEYPGYPGVDCPAARLKMQEDPDNRWMLPRCQPDGTFADLQCHEERPSACMCVAPDGSPLTLPGFGLPVKSCDCFLAQYNIHEYNPQAEMPKCRGDGFFEPLQCSRATGKCWCVTLKGDPLGLPSEHTLSCDEL